MKPRRTVSEMGVLKDIRDLLSPGPPRRGEETAPEPPDWKDQKARYEEEISQLRGLTGRQREELERLREENRRLSEALKALQDEKGGAGKPDQEVADLEARKAELSSALSEVEEALRLTLKELMRRVARAFQEAGEQGLALEFRRGADRLEMDETLAYFLRLLLRQ